LGSEPSMPWLQGTVGSYQIELANFNLNVKKGFGQTLIAKKLEMNLKIHFVTLVWTGLLLLINI
jgi:hypothetical protein